MGDAVAAAAALLPGVRIEPTRRAVILQRLGDAYNAAAGPLLAELAGRLRAELVRRWGEVPLSLAPAFR